MTDNDTTIGFFLLKLLIPSKMGSEFSIYFLNINYFFSISVMRVSVSSGFGLDLVFLFIF
jgi:hypothetical protein